MAVVKTRETLMTNIDVTNFVTKAVITPPKKNAPALWEELFFGCFLLWQFTACVHYWPMSKSAGVETASRVSPFLGTD